MFTWDEAKRRANLPKHGIDFVDASKAFEGLTFRAEDDREPCGEDGVLTLWLPEDQVVSVAHAERGDEIRIIFIRKATRHEARCCFSQITN